MFMLGDEVILKETKEVGIIYAITMEPDCDYIYDVVIDDKKIVHELTENQLYDYRKSWLNLL